MSQIVRFLQLLSFLYTEISRIHFQNIGLFVITLKNQSSCRFKILVHFISQSLNVSFLLLQVAGIFKHKSLGSRIHYKVVKIVLLESDDVSKIFSFSRLRIPLNYSLYVALVLSLVSFESIQNTEKVSLLLLLLQIGFSVYKGNPSRTLRSACEYTTSLKHSDEKHPDHFDVAIAITR